jgi:predicted nucleotidyltransferase
MSTDLLDDVTRTIVERFHPKRIVLFGSYARGDARPDNDLDLFIEREFPRRPPERAADVSAIFRLRPWPLEVVLYTPDEVKHRGKRVEPAVGDRERRQGFL